MKEFKYKINGTEYLVEIAKIENEQAEVQVNGTSYNVEIIREQPKKAVVKPIVKPAPAPVTPIAKPTAAPASTTGGRGIKAPLPGVIIDVLVQVGDTVKRGQKVAILEAMKMENNINSDVDGVVQSIPVKKGDSIMEGMDIVVIG